jgi:3-oxoacyl-[acyl-carrier protein] reductase
MAGVKGRGALVTGAGSDAGIGFATARILAAQGARVAITSTTKRIFDRLAELHGGKERHFALVADLTEPAAATNLVAEARKAIGSIDILVNNAGMTQLGRPDRASLFHRISDKEWTEKIELNLNTAFRVTRAVLPAMMRRGYGRIVHIASVTGPLVSNPRSAGYGAAKAGMIGMARAIAIEVADKGITINAVAPGWIETDMTAAVSKDLLAQVPARRAGTPEEVAACVRFLASEQASYVTGAVLTVDGGLAA